jgi:hypothetical protein
MSAAPAALAAAPVHAFSRGALIAAMAGAVCAALGLATLTLYLLLPKRSRQPSVAYFGAFTALYGGRLLSTTGAGPALIGGTPPAWGYFNAWTTFVLPIPLLLFAELLHGAGWRSSIRRIRQVWYAFSVVAVLASLFRRDSLPMLQAANNVLVLVLAVVLLPHVFHASAAAMAEAAAELQAFRFGAVVFLLFALNENLAGSGLVPWGTGAEWLGFLIFVSCLGYAAAHRTVRLQGRLSRIEHELETARRIQASILPREVPRTRGLRLPSVTCRWRRWRAISTTSSPSRRRGPACWWPTCRATGYPRRSSHRW